MGVLGLPLPFTRDWRIRAPESAGFLADIADRLDRDMAAGAYPGLHGLLIVRHNSLILERYFEGADERWGTPLGLVRHAGENLHDVRSVTKSVVSLLYGIALNEGLVPPAAARLIDQFPQYLDLAADPQRRAMTVAHALTMRLGIAWHEDMTYSDPNNGEHEMEAAPDRYRNILERPIVHQPGTVWNYCGGATAILGHLIAKGAGMQLEAYAKERLFDPLGISEFEWVNGADGEAAASSGLRLRPRDLARIGQMILNKGSWQDTQIVPENWLALSFKPRAYAEKDLRYGYQWWLGKLLSGGKPWYGAFGNGGQRLLVIPSLDMVVVIMAGNYNRDDQWKMPPKLMSQLVITSLSAAEAAA